MIRRKNVLKRKRQRAAKFKEFAAIKPCRADTGVMGDHGECLKCEAAPGVDCLDVRAPVRHRERPA